MYSLSQLKNDKSIWSKIEILSVSCSWCNTSFDVKYGTIYNIIRRNADGIFCSPKCSGSFRTKETQQRYLNDGGKNCKRCLEFLSLDNFCSMPNPPYFRSECKRCHNNKPAKYYSLIKLKSKKQDILFNISLDDFLSVFNYNCFYCNNKLRHPKISLKNKEFGYIKNNIIIVCEDCQSFRYDMEHDNFINKCIVIAKNFKWSDNVKSQ